MVVKKGYKQTEVGVIPEDWDLKKLGSIADVSAGGTPSRNVAEYWNGGIPWVTTTELDFGRIKATSQNISALGLKSSAAKLLNPGTILLALYGQGKTRGKVAILDIEATSNQACAAIVLSEAFSRPFIFRYLASKYDFIRGLSNTGNQENLNGVIVKSIPIPLPPTLAEQEAIAGALSDADAWIESLEQLIAKKRQIKQGAMQELLTGKRRLPGFSGKWETKRLGELASLYQPTTISAASFTSFGYPVYGANGIVGYFSSYNHSTWQVTVTCRGSTCGTVNKTVDKCWITGNAMVVNCDQNHDIDKPFLFHLLSKQDLTVCITGTGQPQIVRTPLAAVELRLPNKILEQTAIATILSDMDSEIESLESKLAKAREIKQGMMQELLTGRIRLVKSSAVSAKHQEMSHDR
jgi:type I restriction enzyme S subunit